MAENTYTVERSAIIDAPAERIYEQIVNFHQWTNWSPWEDLDASLQRSYSGAEQGVGAVYGWSGNRKAGQGRMEIVEVAEPSRVRIDLVFEKPFKARNDSVFSLVPADRAADRLATGHLAPRVHQLVGSGDRRNRGTPRWSNVGQPGFRGRWLASCGTCRR